MEMHFPVRLPLTSRIFAMAKMKVTCIISLGFVSAVLLSGFSIKRSTLTLLPDAVIERFEAIPDCIFPDPRRGVLSYRVTGDLTRVTISALHRGGRVRPFHTQASRSPSPLFTATNVVDPGAAPDVEGYRLVATGATGPEVRRDLPFRYRVAEFVLVSPVRHLRDTTDSTRYARYEAEA